MEAIQSIDWMHLFDLKTGLIKADPQSSWVDNKLWGLFENKLENGTHFLS